MAGKGVGGVRVIGAPVFGFVDAREHVHMHARMHACTHTHTTPSPAHTHTHTCIHALSLTHT